jgi:hypothetical protein
MKFLIKKYLQFEKQYGSAEDLQRAKERITRYVTSTDASNGQLAGEHDELEF